MDNSDGSILGVMEDIKGYEMFVFLWFTYSITCMHLTASISIPIYLCRLVDEVGKTRKPSVLDCCAGQTDACESFTGKTDEMKE